MFATISATQIEMGNDNRKSVYIRSKKKCEVVFDSRCLCVTNCTRQGLQAACASLLIDSKRNRKEGNKLYGLEEEINIVMFTDQICQKKKEVKK